MKPNAVSRRRRRAAYGHCDRAELTPTVPSRSGGSWTIAPGTGSGHACHSGPRVGGDGGSAGWRRARAASAGAVPARTAGAAGGSRGGGARGGGPRGGGGGKTLGGGGGEDPQQRGGGGDRHRARRDRVGREAPAAERQPGHQDQLAERDDEELSVALG